MQEGQGDISGVCGGAALAACLCAECPRAQSSSVGKHGLEAGARKTGYTVEISSVAASAEWAPSEQQDVWQDHSEGEAGDPQEQADEWWVGQKRVRFRHRWVEGARQGSQLFRQGRGCFSRKARLFFCVVYTCLGEADGLWLLACQNLRFSLTSLVTHSCRLKYIETLRAGRFCFLSISATLAIWDSDQCC